GKDVTVTINMDGVFINDAQVTVADLDADNGVVHVINAVLLPPDPTVFDIISDSPDHNTLQALLEAASLDAVLSEEGTLTVFAPTDEAFSVLPQDVIDQLLADPSGQLTDILTYHVTSSVISSGDLVDRTIATSLNGLDYLVTAIEGGGFTINANGGPGAQITVTDLVGTNGVVHVIDAIMLPSTNASIIFNSQGFEILSQILQLTGLADNQNSSDTRTTLFAPTNDAFLAVPEDILESLVAAPQKLTDALLYHVVEGRTFASDLSDQLIITTAQGETATITLNADGAFINNAQILVTDFFTGNGIIHIIDAVLLPAPTTVMDVVIRSEDHTILQIALDTANLSTTLQGDGTFTVFAPTDAAFAELPTETLNALLSEPGGQLTDILLYHVLGSEVLSTDLSDGMTATTLNGADITVTIDDDNVFINDAQVIAADIVTENGIVHVIDVVLLPPVGTEELPSSEVNIYPSPASNLVTVDFENNQFDDPTIYILDNNGRAIRNIKNAQSGQVIDVSDMQNGMYTVVISDAQFSITKRITKID
ncbi:MAG: putative surface protein with fasciclin (FAS1) repeats, partial [Halioglobus sp.]